MSDLVKRAQRRAYVLREDQRGFDAALIEELLEALAQAGPNERCACGAEAVHHECSACSAFNNGEAL